MRLLYCKNCGLPLIYLEDDGLIKAKNTIMDNIQSPPPQVGDLFNLVCQCGFRIIGATPEYLIEK